MKKSIFVLMAVLSFALVLCCNLGIASAATYVSVDGTEYEIDGTNYVPNGSFEEEIGNAWWDNPNTSGGYWTVWNGDATAANSNGGASSGSRSFQFGMGGQWTMAVQTVTLEPGKKYVYSCYVKSPVSFTATGALYDSEKSAEPVGYYDCVSTESTGGQWRHVEVFFTVDSYSINPYFYISTGIDNSQVFIDDVAIYALVDEEYDITPDNVDYTVDDTNIFSTGFEAGQSVNVTMDAYNFGVALKRNVNMMTALYNGEALVDSVTTTASVPVFSSRSNTFPTHLSLSINIPDDLDVSNCRLETYLWDADLNATPQGEAAHTLYAAAQE